MQKRWEGETLESRLEDFCVWASFIHGPGVSAAGAGTMKN